MGKCLSLSDWCRITRPVFQQQQQQQKVLPPVRAGDLDVLKATGSSQQVHLLHLTAGPQQEQQELQEKQEVEVELEARPPSASH